MGYSELLRLTEVDWVPWLSDQPIQRSASQILHRMKPPKETTDSPVQAAWWSSPGVLYFFAAGSPPVAIKIGVAALTNGCTLQEGVMRRLRDIQTSNHELVELLGLILFSDGQYPTRLAEVLERELHIKFAQFQRFKPGTRGAEWFTPSPELLEYIQGNAQQPESLGVPRFVGQRTVSAEQAVAADGYAYGALLGRAALRR